MGKPKTNQSDYLQGERELQNAGDMSMNNVGIYSFNF